MAATRPPPIWIAELRVVFVHPDGRRVPGRIAVGQPYTLAGADPAASYESHCPVEIDGVHSRLFPIVGEGTLGALLLGVQFLGSMLHDFVSRGGRVLYPNSDVPLAEDDSGVDVPLSALFGPMLRAFNLPDSDSSP
jgi:hypothetical protein